MSRSYDRETRDNTGDYADAAGELAMEREDEFDDDWHDDDGEDFDPRDYDDDDFDIDFAYPGGNSALRAASASNPRNLPCPTCHQPNRLTPADRACGYQCDSCADRAERGW